MVKKQTSKQNIIIIVLCLLLLLSIGFGVTYAYFNVSSEKLVSGNITVITMELDWVDQDEQVLNNGAFTLHSGGTVYPGQPLENSILKLQNKTTAPIYAIMVYSLAVTDSEGNPVNIDTTKMNAMDIYNSTTPTSDNPVVGAGWRKYEKTYEDGKKLQCLVYLGESDEGVLGEGMGIFPANTSVQVLDANNLKIPSEWGNEMQGMSITLSFQAFVVTASELYEIYPNVISDDLETRKNGIVEAIFTECQVEETIYPTQQPAQDPAE